MNAAHQAVADAFYAKWGADGIDDTTFEKDAEAAIDALRTALIAHPEAAEQILNALGMEVVGREWWLVAPGMKKPKRPVFAIREEEEGRE